MKKYTAVMSAIIISILVVLAAYVALSYENNNSSEESNSESEREWVQPIAPTESEDNNLTLSVTYPGQGIMGYGYATNQAYTFNLNIAPNNWTGDANIVAFAERSDGGISMQCVTMSVNGSDAHFSLNHVNSENVLNASAGKINISNGSESLPMNISFNRVGNFTIIFQAFDEKGESLSAPLFCSGLNVPESGSIRLNVVETSIAQEDGSDYTVIKADIENQTNVRTEIRASEFYISNNSRSIQADPNLSNPTSRILDFKGDSYGNDKMQIELYFDYSGSLSGYQLEYVGSYSADSVSFD